MDKKNSNSSKRYHEKQTGTLCAIHSCNNLLGKQTFNLQDFQTIKTTLAIPDEQGRCTSVLNCLPKCCCTRCRQDEGNFDANIITMALAKHSIDLNFWDTRNKDTEQLLDLMKDEDCIGLLINQQAGYHNCLKACVIKCLAFCFGNNGHWVAIKKENNESNHTTQFIDLNSQFNAPNIYVGDNETKPFLTKHLNSNSHILIANLLKKKNQRQLMR